ncbi:MAG: hypothetical protein Nk1A_8650 [Endomicrobiia bacterium]|nr:MAG: hypothetical protein Nk1A_8650 [Endomicrobiia bacterium]
MYSDIIGGPIYLIFKLEGIEDFNFNVLISYFDKDNIYLTFESSSTKNTHYGINLWNGDQDIEQDNLNGADLRGVTFEIDSKTNDDDPFECFCGD